MIGAIIQARMGSSRLPGKVLKNVDGMTLLEYQISRIKKSKNINKIIVATTINNIDDEIVDFCKNKDIGYFRGSENDVLSRYYECAKLNKIETIVRITADCPLIDPIIIDKVIDLFRTENADYASNTVPPDTSMWPDGSDIEVFSANSLELANNQAVLAEEREHVTFFFWKNSTNKFKTSQLKNKFNWSGYRFTIDYKEDFEVFKFLKKEINRREIFGTTGEVINILDENPKIRDLNNKYYFGIGWSK